MNDEPQGRVDEMPFFDEQDKLVENAVGYASTQQKRDRVRDVIEQSCFDRLGKLVARVNRLMTGEELRDLMGQFGKLALSAALSDEEIAAIGQGGFARITQQFDARGNPTCRAFFGVEDKSTAGLNGAAVEEVGYDTHDRPTVFRPTGANGTAAQVETRIAYDDVGAMKRIDFVGPDRRPVNGRQGFASIVIAKENGAPVTLLLDAEGKELQGR